MSPTGSNPNLKVELGMSPQEADLAIVSIDSRGTPGDLNMLVLKEYGYDIDSLPGAAQLKRGFAGIADPKRKPILFVVTVGEGSTYDSLEKNLANALKEFHNWFVDKCLWIPLMGTGSGGLDLKISYQVTRAVVESHASSHNNDFSCYITVPNSEEGIELYKSILSGNLSHEQTSNTNKTPGNSNTEPKLYLVGGFWSGQDQTTRFLLGNIWENGHEDRFVDEVSSVKPGDFLFLKSTYAAREVGYLRIKAVGVVKENPETGYDLKVHWRVKFERPIDIADLSYYRDAFAEVAQKDIEILINGIGISRLIILGPYFEKLSKVDDSSIPMNYWFLKIFGENWNLPLKPGTSCHFNSHFSSRDPIPNQHHFQNIKKGDKGVAYDFSTEKGIAFFFEVTKGLYNSDSREEIFEFRITETIQPPVSIRSIQSQLYFANEIENSPERLFPLSADMYAKIEELLEVDIKLPDPILKSNVLHRTKITNDGVQGEKDLLGFDKDIRSFASLIALKELKPPLAIALFGEWGAGKSFFMRNLQQKIEFLSRYQSFEEILDGDHITGEELQPFCKGIVHISFNAWSYMDANLWASLVANIFEQLDEYISGQTKGKAQQQQATEFLNKNLSIVNEKKESIVAEKKTLEEEKYKLLGKIEEIEKQKSLLISKAASKTHLEIYNEIILKMPLDTQLKSEIEKYGLAVNDLSSVSPGKLYMEVKSWYQFGKNLMKFSGWQLGTITLGVIALLMTIYNPNGVVDRFLNFTQATFSSFLLMAAPIIFKIIRTFKRLNQITEPLRSYRDRFNAEFQRVNNEYEKEIAVAEAELSVVTAELFSKTSQLEELNIEIEEIEHEKKHSMTGRAFFEFIKNKSKDSKYDQNLSIITTIRRDFETLSELFQSYNIPKDLDPEDRKKAIERKKEIEKFQNLFNKPLDRIVLYVDDLDRCTEERVIEVLEAVNLLMAFPLFVVVVGVDPRWVKSALIKKYTLQFTGLLTSSSLEDKFGLSPINVTDYLEKIFQIPFHLQEADPAGINSLIDDMLGQQVEAERFDTKTPGLQESTSKMFDHSEAEVMPLPNIPTTGSALQLDTKPEVVAEKPKTLVRIQPKDLLLASYELEDLKYFAWLMGTNPRALKRYINIYRIIRAHENLTFDQTSEKTNFRCIMILIGICIGEYRSVAKKFCQYCNEHPDESLTDFFNSLDAADPLSIRSKIIKVTDQPILDSVKLKDFNHYIPFVKRFSFDNPLHA